MDCLFFRSKILLMDTEQTCLYDLSKPVLAYFYHFCKETPREF